MTNVRTIISAVDPVRVRGTCVVRLKVWFEELNEPVMFIALPYDCEIHGRELWVRAMGGEYGPVKLVDAAAVPRMIQHDLNR
jgi:hypothetical protein